MTPKQLLNQLEGVFKDEGIKNPYFETWWKDLCDLVEDAYPDLVSIHVGGKYGMKDKHGRDVVMQCTKENQKTWVMYELEDSARPGCRWMIQKGWCQDGKIWPVITSSMIPVGVKVK